jgi:hypothetical protein
MYITDLLGDYRSNNDSEAMEYCFLLHVNW